jgi:hypothetical protein
MINPFDRIGINWSAISEKLSSVAKTDLGDILIAFGTGMNALRKARKQRELEEDEEDEYEDDEEDDDDEDDGFKPLKH